MPEQLFPVTIAGAGIVGSVLALALAQAGHRVCLIEARPPAVDPADPRGRRPIALSLASERIFRGLGIWPAIAPHAAAIRMVHVSERGHFGMTRIRAGECGVGALGQVCEAQYIEAALASALDDYAGSMGSVQRLCPFRVRQADPREHRVQVQLGAAESPGEVVKTLQSRLLVAADGADSGLRDAYQLPVLEREYRQLALVCRVRTTEPHQGRAFERFTGQGLLALLPLADGGSAVVWSLPGPLAGDLAAHDDDRFMAIVQEQFGQRLGQLNAVSARHCFPLKLVKSRALTGPRFAIVGNAAQQLHPVAGQGLNLGLRDVALLAELVAGQLQGGGDPGSPGLLKAYARRRRDDRRWVTGFTDLLARGITPRFAKLSPVRAMGLLCVDLLPFVKSTLARRTMGLAGYQPRLVRGLALQGPEPACPELGR